MSNEDNNTLIEDIKKLIDQNKLEHYTIKIQNDVRKNGSVPQRTKKSMSWVVTPEITPETNDDNKIIYLEYNDEKTFLKTNKTPDQVKQIIQVYLNQNTL
jgi:hypothetical protein